MIFQFFKRTLGSCIFIVVLPFLLFLTSIIALIARRQKVNQPEKARLVWGPVPIINNKYWSKAMKEAGFESQTLMTGFSGVINKKDDYEEYTSDRYPYVPGKMKNILLFWESLFRFDVFFVPFSGWLLGKSRIWFLEPYLLKLAGKRIVVIPFGSDAYVYRNVRSLVTLHGLLMSYPAAARNQNQIEKYVKLWAEHADCIPSTGLNADGIGRWDVLCFNPLSIDIDEWKISTRANRFDGKTGHVTVVHAPNHTGFKGSEFIIDAVNKLKAEGLSVELKLLQNVQNSEVRRILEEETDILVDQLVFTGHGLKSIEGMASGLPVICNLEDEEFLQLFRNWSYLNECPLVSANPENIADQLRALVVNPELRGKLGECSRNYVEKYHSQEACAFLFSNILSYIYGERKEIINLYHPILGEYNKSKPMITPPLSRNKIVQ